MRSAQVVDLARRYLAIVDSVGANQNVAPSVRLVRRDIFRALVEATGSDTGALAAIDTERAARGNRGGAR